jgi:acyl-ACP thioesterase
MNSIHYPELKMEKNKNLDLKFTNMKESVEEKDFVYSKTIRSMDIDLNDHTNNLRYNFMAIDAFSVEELKSFNIKEYEIYFVNESYWGDKIDVYKKRIKNYYYIEGKNQDKTIFRSVIKFKKKER